MIHGTKVEVALKDENLDSNGFSVKKDIEDDLQIKGIDSVKTTEWYSLLDPIPEEVVEKVFIDPLIQKFSLNDTTLNTIFENYDFYIDVRLNEHVTDNVGIIAKEAVEDYLGKKIEGRVLAWKRYYLYGKISKKDVERIAEELLVNEVIETFEVKQK